MEGIIITVLKYVICLLINVYTLYSFIVFRRKNQKRKEFVYRFQTMLLFLIHATCFLCIYLGGDLANTAEVIKLGVFYAAQVTAFIFAIILYKVSYKKLSKLVFNNMLMLIMLGLVMLTRLDFEAAIKQFIFVCAGLGLCIIVPFIIKKIRYLKEFGWLYGFAGLACLLLVLVVGKAQYGAKNWIIIGGFAMQPSEFVKILFVFFVASCFSKAKDFKAVVKVTLLAATHVIVLVLERDLGGALIFFMTYLVMLYVATCNIGYLLAGLLSGSAASVAAYRMFSHVRVRVIAWKDPFLVIDREGYQITQSLFAIGTGGWFGMGLTRGLPTSIPVVNSDFIFSAIMEEMGGIVGICIILICLSCFLMFINISMKMRDDFYRLIALGLSVLYMFQVFLTIGGVIKFIPSTGVTLPLISSGGSSILSTLIMFSIIQGLYVLNQDEVDAIEKEKREKNRTRTNHGRSEGYENREEIY